MHCKDTILRTQNNWPYSKLIPNSGQKGKIPIDIDLLLWNGTILKPADWEKEYVQLLFRSVAD